MSKNDIKWFWKCPSQPWAMELRSQTFFFPFSIFKWIETCETYRHQTLLIIHSNTVVSSYPPLLVYRGSSLKSLQFIFLEGFFSHTCLGKGTRAGFFMYRCCCRKFYILRVYFRSTDFLVLKSLCPAVFSETVKDSVMKFTGIIDLQIRMGLTWLIMSGLTSGSRRK